MTDFIKIYGTLIIAVIAFIQPYVWAIYKGYFRQGRIDIHESGRIEIGFDRFGPTVALMGTLQSIHQDLFVHSIELELIRDKDSSKHKFEWSFFQPYGITAAGEPDGMFEVPYGFMLLTASPRRYNIRFYDTQLGSEMWQLLNEIREEWWRMITTTLKINELSHLSSQYTASDPALEEQLAKLWQKYRKSEFLTQSYDTLSRMCYWETGKFTLRMLVRTSNPPRSFEKSWHFTLIENDVRSIRLNVVRVLQATCGRPSFGQGFYAYTIYE